MGSFSLFLCAGFTIGCYRTKGRMVNIICSFYAVPGKNKLVYYIQFTPNQLSDKNLKDHPVVKRN
jgi:hypothetical protein